MEGLFIFLTVFITLVCSVVTALLAPFRQRTLRFNPDVFKRIKVPFPFSWLFAGTGSKEQRNVREYGVILPMFILHIVGYVLAIFICALIPSLYYRVGVELDILVVVPLAVAVPYVLAVFVTELLCAKYARRTVQEGQDEINLGYDEPSDIALNDDAVTSEQAEEVTEQVVADTEETAEEPTTETVEEVTEQPAEVVEDKPTESEETTQTEQSENPDEQPADTDKKTDNE